MGLAEQGQIDVVSLTPDGRTVVLSLVADAPWGARGERLPALQAKLNTYLAYALDGQLHEDYPQVAGKAVRFRLHYAYPPTQREQDFIDLVCRDVLAPEGIGWEQSSIAE
jgi:hypothetical protein